MSCGSSNAGDQLANQQRQQQKLTDESVGKINQAFQGFNPNFYNGVAQTYQNWALPQVGQQFQQNQNQLQYKLANQGLGNSSQSQFLNNQLSQAKTQAQQQVAQQGLQQEQQLQQQVGQQKNQLIGQAQTATSPNAIGQQAISAAAGFGAPSSFQPLGNMFSQFGQYYLANQLANTYNPATQQLNGLGFSNPFQYSTSGNFLPSTSFGH